MGIRSHPKKKDFANSEVAVVIGGKANHAPSKAADKESDADHVSIKSLQNSALNKSSSSVEVKQKEFLMGSHLRRERKKYP